MPRNRGIDGGPSRAARRQRLSRRTDGPGDCRPVLGCSPSLMSIPRSRHSGRIAAPADPRTALTDTLMEAERGTLDRGAAERLLQIAFYPVGTVVELSDGSVARVVAVHPPRADVHSPARPSRAIARRRSRRAASQSRDARPQSMRRPRGRASLADCAAPAAPDGSLSGMGRLIRTVLKSHLRNSKQIRHPKN